MAVLLLLVSALPIAVGAYILAGLAAGHAGPETARHLASPLPVVLHVVAAATYAIFGAFQFVAAFRRGAPGWHRRAGRVLLVCGIVAGMSGVWMTLFYARPPDTGDLLFAIRLFFSAAMVIAVVLGFAAIRRHDVPGHRAWMMRAYALGLGASTQALVLMVAELAAGPPDQFGKALLMGLAWIINLAIAEWVIRRRAPHRPLIAVENDRTRRPSQAR